MGGPTYCAMRVEKGNTEHVLNSKFTWFTVPGAFRPLTKHIHSKTHTLYPFCCCGSEALTRSEADVCQQSPPCLPLAALTMSSSKAAPAEGEWRAFFPQSPSAWFLPRSAHSWTFNSFQFPNVGASATSDSESRAIVTTTELVLSFKLGGLGTHNAEQLTHWERPRRFLFFMRVCGEMISFFYSVCFISNSTGTFSLLQVTVLLQWTKPLNICPVQTILATMTRSLQHLDDARFSLCIRHQ